jgi:hypothetical protein
MIDSKESEIISLDSFFERSEDLVWREIEGEIVILKEDGRNIHTLNKVAGTIFSLADGSRNAQSIANEICQRYNVSLEKAQDDVLEFCDSLVKKKILKVHN